MSNLAEEGDHVLFVFIRTIFRYDSFFILICWSFATRNIARLTFKILVFLDSLYKDLLGLDLLLCTVCVAVFCVFADAEAHFLLQ